MDSKSLELRRQIGAITPHSIERAKQFAKQLHKLYRGHSLAECQEATAHIFGHPDWHTLDKSVKTGSQPPRFDEDLDDDALDTRFTAQSAILALDMDDVDPESDYEPPRPPETPGMGMDTMARLDRAGKRHTRKLTEMLLWELKPTAREQPGVGVVFDTSLGVATQATMAKLPELIGHWWQRNLKHQPEVGSALVSFEWNKDRPTSVLHFGGYWGELCMHYARTIDWKMCMGTAYLLASQYAESILQRLQIFHEAAGDNVAQWQSVRFDKETLELHKGLMWDFLMAYPRDDMVSAGPDALKANAKEVLEILQSNSSKGGLWRP